MAWQETANAKRKAVFELIPSEWRIESPPSNESQPDITGQYIQQFLTEREIEITETPVEGILARTTTGLWKAEEVTRAFCHRAALAHQLTGCLLEIFFDLALERARWLDERFAADKRPVGVLHGLPISLKDQFHLPGVETSMGYTGWIGTFQGRKDDPRYKTFESELAQELRDCGAVFYVKTTVPHSLMTGETVNNIMGYCWNPKNRHLSAGGSSGGEGALIGLKGSPLGFGTDIGGSIRIPAAFNGLYGIRPTHGRLPYEGMANSMDGQNTILSVVGPLTHSSPQGLRIVMKAILSKEPWLRDPLVVELPWRDAQAGDVRDRPMSFGVIRHDGVVGTHPPVARAVEETVKKLQAAGHEVIDWEPTVPHSELEKVALTSWTYDGGEDVHKDFALSGEPVAPQVSISYGHAPKEQVNASKIAETNVQKREIQKKYMEYWNSTALSTRSGKPVDAVICPLAPFAAARPETFIYVGYSMWVNLLDYTAVTFPVTNVNKSVDKAEPLEQPRNERDKIIHGSYDPEIFDGAHVSLQLVGRRFQEEKLLTLAERVGKIVAARTTL